MYGVQNKHTNYNDIIIDKLQKGGHFGGETNWPLENDTICITSLKITSANNYIIINPSHAGCFMHYILCSYFTVFNCL